jgi:hypothetical protein
VVLSSLARLCVPCFSDECAVELSEGLDPAFKVSFPPPAEELAPRYESWSGNQPPAGTTVITALDMASADGCPSFSGHIVHSWTLRSPTAGATVIARLLVDHALAVIRHERLAERVRAAEERSACLAREAMAGQSIGEAVGIVMAMRNLGQTDALTALQDASRQWDCSLHEASVHVVQAFARTPADPLEPPTADLTPVVSLERRRLAQREGPSIKIP